MSAGGGQLLLPQPPAAGRRGNSAFVHYLFQPGSEVSLLPALVCCSTGYLRFFYFLVLFGVYAEALVSMRFSSSSSSQSSPFESESSYKAISTLISCFVLRFLAYYSCDLGSSKPTPWDFICNFNRPAREQAFPHPSEVHTKGFRPEWVRWWACMWPFVTKTAWQISHRQGLSPVQS